MSKSSDRKLIAEIIKALEEQGWTVDDKNPRHIKAYAPDRRTIVVIPRTPSDHRSIPNTLSTLRKAGFLWRR